jgi:hypothetical protein
MQLLGLNNQLLQACHVVFRNIDGSRCHMIHTLPLGYISVRAQTQFSPCGIMASELGATSSHPHKSHVVEHTDDIATHRQHRLAAAGCGWLH